MSSDPFVRNEFGVIPPQNATHMTHERKCWTCGNIAEHADRIVPHVLCQLCGSQDTRATKRPKPFEPTASQLHSACLSYRHDYGILDDDGRESLRLTAMEWFRAWQKEGLTK